MSVDVQVILPQAVIPLSSVQELLGMTPRTVQVVGQDFRAVESVEINGMDSPDVVIPSQTQLLAQVPPALGLSPITSVNVISNQITLTAKSIIRFMLGPSPSKVRGILRLTQIFLKILFTTPGSDIFAPKIGGGAQSELGETFGTNQGGNIVSSFVVAVANTQRQIQAIQARDPSLPLDERLLAAKVVAGGFDTQRMALVVSVEVTSQSGRVGLANVAV